MHTTVKMDKKKNSCSFLNVALYCILYLIVSSSLSSVVVVVTALSTTATTTTPKIIRIGTRPSPLAKIQAKAVAKALQNILTKRSNCEVEIQIIDILTTGDQSPASSSSSSSSPSVVQAQPLAVQSVDFTGALDRALLHNEIDIAVHSLKDIPPSTRWCHGHGHGIEIASCLKREDPLDVLVVSMVTTATNTVSHSNSESKASNPPNCAPGEGLDLCIQNLPRNARVGTSSVRRQAQLLSMRKDLELVNLRGNVGARLKALEDGTVDALLLAAAGLNRLLSNDGGGAGAGAGAGKKNQMASNVCWRDIPSEDILSGSCQGIVATTCRSSDSTTLNLLREIDHHDSSIAAAAERTFLDGLDSFRPTLYEGSTEWIGRPPLAALMTKRGLDDDAIEKWDSGWTFRGLLARPDGLTVIKTLKTTHGALSIDDARALGKEQAEKLLLEAGPDFYR
jgi:hydroxymethylbilane synthase